MTVRRLWQAMPVLALLASVSFVGCGGTGDTTETTVTVTESEPAAQTSAAPPPQKTAEERAEDTVRAYYGAVDRGSYSRAWSLLSPGLQAELGGFASWRAGYETTTATEAFGVRTIEASASSAVVELEIESTDIDECGTTVHQTFAGTWSLASEGGHFRATSFNVEKTDGGTPVLDPSSCEYEEPESYESEEEGGYLPEEGSGCDPNYTGCVPESFGDVDCDEVGEEVEVVGEDVYGLDLEEDGYACETY